ncbi:endonuclease/exonuclease/phosphatase family protein [Rhizobium sp. 'Codium 1']|uniref:endonuclease/exonuclease/phosphatase family protein n=1 Tax=Rhizobium sp. 'Codium 1' TaxID=2940484 RepID=UPI001E577292|nr:endonuclease/exonuclease/phosphatase family protein [Rhizobium sp. 'Codium 1']MCC8933782.1 endonuclease/exonuclease/phosphatase family protein [Rhizobium sp. 'Codium 1']
MKIMCLNGWGGKLHQELTAYVKDVSPDILCLQEVTHSPAAESEWLTYRDGDHILPQRANFFRDVAHVLPDHVSVFCPAAQGTLWDGERAVPSQWGLATFVHSALPVTAQAQGFVHKAFSPHGYGEHPRSRSAHAIRVYDYEQDRFLCIAHMHGLRDLNGKSDTPDRRLQAERLVELVAHVSEPEDGLIVCGDFNIEPNSETFEILGTLGLVDLVTTRGIRGTRTSHYAKPGRFADYMLVNEHVAVSDFSVVFDPEVSDHCPLVLTI